MRRDDRASGRVRWSGFRPASLFRHPSDLVSLRSTSPPPLSGEEDNESSNTFPPPPRGRCPQGGGGSIGYRPERAETAPSVAAPLARSIATSP